MSEKNKQDIANALFRVKLTNSSLTDNEFKASKQRGFKLIWKQFDKMIEDNPNNARGILALLSSSSSQQGHFMRTGSTYEFKNLEDGATVEGATKSSAFLDQIRNTLDKGIEGVKKQVDVAFQLNTRRTCPSHQTRIERKPWAHDCSGNIKLRPMIGFPVELHIC